jgi:hypothetical protein
MSISQSKKSANNMSVWLPMRGDTCFYGNIIGYQHIISGYKQGQASIHTGLSVNDDLVLVYFEKEKNCYKLILL